MSKTAHRVSLNTQLVDFFANGGKVTKLPPGNAKGLSSLKRSGLFGGSRAFAANMAHRGGVGNGGLISSPRVGKYGRVRS